MVSGHREAPIAPQLLSALRALRRGHFSHRLPSNLTGIEGEIAETFNDVMELSDGLARELTRMRRTVGREGRFAERARLPGASGRWQHCIDSVNELVEEIVQPTTEVARVIDAVAKGDLSQTMETSVDGRPLKGEFRRIARTANTMVERLGLVSSEVTRVAREVGTEGNLGGQAQVTGATGTWRALTDNVNAMAGNLTSQVRNIAEVTTAVANGDLSKKITVDVKGEILELKNTINTMVDQLGSFASEVTRVAREVGTEGKLGGQAQVTGVTGTWKDLTDNVNAMAGNLTSQVRNIAEVTTAVANGDLSKKITVDVKGEILELKDTINTMVDQLGSFASEVTRVAREVGTEGKLGGQAQVEGVAGTWKDLTDNVNLMATNLTNQVRNIAEVTTAVAKGDLSKKITVDVKGEILKLKDTINTMVDQLGSFASEVTRVAREVGTEGKLGGQAQVEGVAGTWKDLTDNVNLMATNLTNQVRNIAEVTTAVATGDLSKKITVDVKGEILELKDTINTMVDQLGSFASEVTRVAREVGTEGKLGGQAQVEGVAGTWKDLTDKVNAMATNLTEQVRNIAEVTTAVATGDLSKKIEVDVKGEILELKDTINTMVDQLGSFASEVTRVAREVGTEGKLGGQARVDGVAGTWKDLTDNVNAMATNLTGQVRNIAEVTTAVAKGDLSKKITVDVKGEILELKNTINTMVDQLNSFASEVTRVAREVGTEGKLGGQAQVDGVAGTWKDLTDNVNAMATNLTGQVRNIAEVMTAIARGDLTRTLTVDAQGEIAALSDTINGMIATLATFADQVTDVAREVGIEGKLGGQARVPGAAGLWRDLTDNVNQLAANLTTQVRAIAEVATAVTKGDLTRAIAVEASGEVAALKDNINQMIGNLRETTQYNTEQDWLKTNLARFTRMLQGERDLVTVSNLILSELAPLVNACRGVFYVARLGEERPCFELIATYAYSAIEDLPQVTTVRLGEGLVGQCAIGKKRILLTNVPADYIAVWSGLGQGTPLNVVILPVLFEGEVRAVIELASFNKLSQIHVSFLDQLVESIGIVLNTIAATMRTEGLLTQSQMLTIELQSQQEVLKKTNDRLEQQATSLQKSEDLLKAQREELRRKNEELEEKAIQLQAEKRQVEAVNQEVERAKVALEEKAEQLALTSRYKSEFLANMSHELRTPLNSLLILSKVLADNEFSSLDGKQVEYAQTIHAAGSDLLALINDILDLAKIESGTVAVHTSDIRIADLCAHMERTFRQVAAQKNLSFDIVIEEGLSPRLRTDEKRMQQIVMNLLSNAFKFTDAGGVSMTIKAVKSGWDANNISLSSAERVIAFEIRDSGIGISPEHQKTIFEAFQQADGTISRRHGGTGLGLSISRELSTLLGGEIGLSSTLGEGSTFTLYLPQILLTTEETPELPSSVEKLPVRLERSRLPMVPAILPSVDFHPEHKDETRPKMLVVASEPLFRNSALQLVGREGFEGTAVAGATDLLETVRKYAPDGIVLDLQMPNIDGWTLLDQLKHDPNTHHVPVVAVSAGAGVDRRPHSSAFAFIDKYDDSSSLTQAVRRLRSSLSRRQHRVLVIGGPADQRRALAVRLTDGPVAVLDASVARAKRVVKAGKADCLVILIQSGTNPMPLLQWLRNEPQAANVPIIACTPASSSDELLESLQPYLARTVHGDDVGGQLMDAVGSILNINYPAIELKGRASQVAALAGRTVAIIDDDIRNIFSLTALLELHRVNVLYAESGRAGLSLLEQHPEVDIVLIDIMMPELDGYETIREIRSHARLRHLPLIAVTAKAMADDRERCLEAGASDYLSKPIDTGRLLSVLREWLDDGPVVVKHR